MDTFIIIYFVILAIVNFIVYAKLSKYLYMSAGATKADVKKYLSEQAINRQRRLVRWLRRRTPRPDMFEIMLSLCNIITGFTALAPMLIFFLIMSKNNTFVIVLMVLSAIVSLVAAIYGFSYAKKIEIFFEPYFSSSRYKPYEGEFLPETIESEAELYEEPVKPIYTFTPEEKKKVDNQVRITYYTSRVLIFSLIIVMFLSPVIFNKSNAPLNNNTEQTSHNTAEPSVNIESVKKILTNAGAVTYDAYNEARMLFPNFEFGDCLAETGEGLYFGYYELTDEKTAQSLQKTIKSKIINNYKNDEGVADEKDQSNERSNIYILETENIYAVSICDDNKVIYAYCEPINETWLKMVLYNLGYLEKF